MNPPSPSSLTAWLEYLSHTVTFIPLLPDSFLVSKVQSGAKRCIATRTPCSLPSFPPIFTQPTSVLLQILSTASMKSPNVDKLPMVLIAMILRLYFKLGEFYPYEVGLRSYFSIHMRWSPFRFLAWESFLEMPRIVLKSLQSTARLQTGEFYHQYVVDQRSLFCAQELSLRMPRLASEILQSMARLRNGRLLSI